MFCKTVWNGLHILPDGYIRLCSIGANSKLELDMQRCRDKDGNVMHILTHSIQDIMNSDKHREVRLLNVANPDAWSPHCSCCENREIITNFDYAHANKSRRIYLMKIQDAIDKSSYHNKIDKDGNIDWMPTSLDIRFGNLCNQKCIMCGPQYSNQWYDEYTDYYKTTKFGEGGPAHGARVQLLKKENGKWAQPKELQWYEDPKWWPKFETMMPHLRHIYITGGEPMVTPAHDEMLDKLIESGHAKNIWLEYDTNCSTINDNIIARWYKFQKVEIRGSMDAIKEQYELIRFGGKWETFKKNVAILKDHENASNNKIRLTALSTCFQIATAYSIVESEEWCKSIGVPFHLRFLEGPVHLSSVSLPYSAKIKLIEFYKNHLLDCSKADIIIKHLTNHLADDYHKPAGLKEFVTFMDYLDRSRGVNWRSIFPKVDELLASC